MPNPIKLVVNSAGIRDLLRSKEVAADLRRRAERIRDQAGADDHEVQVFIGRNRARATVRTSTYEGRQDEAIHRQLSRALDAGR